MSPQFPYIERTSADPAAGAEITFTAPEDGFLVSLSFQLVSDATAVNRRVAILVDDGADVYGAAVSPVDQAASQTIRYGAAGGQDSFGVAAASGVAAMGLPERLFVPAGGRIRTSTVNLQAGDNFGPMSLAFERE